MVKDRYLMSENRVYECIQYLEVTIDVSSYLAWCRASYEKLRRVFQMHTLRNACESQQQKSNLTLEDYLSKRNRKYLTSDLLCERKSY